MATRGVRRETNLSWAAPLQTVTTKSSALAALVSIAHSARSRHGHQHGAYTILETLVSALKPVRAQNLPKEQPTRVSWALSMCVMLTNPYIEAPP